MIFHLRSTTELTAFLLYVVSNLYFLPKLTTRTPDAMSHDFDPYIRLGKPEMMQDNCQASKFQDEKYSLC
jgi:hypothetical protein